MSRSSISRTVWQRVVDQNAKMLKWSFGLLSLFLIVYSAAFILRSSIVIEGKRYFCLFDDAMISMCYASNWAEGHGIVWNPGEYVEGYTSFLWTGTLALLHLPGLEPSTNCLLAQILGALILIGILASTWRLANCCRLLPIATIPALALVAFQPHLQYLTLFGMETGLLCLLVTIGMGGVIRSIRNHRGRFEPLIWLALACLVRMDALPIVLAIAAVNLLCVRDGRGRIVLGVALVASLLGAHALWRHS